MTPLSVSAVSDVIRNRHSSRGTFDPLRKVSDADLLQILEAARWAPTPSNMQNFEVLLVDDAEQLKRIFQIPTDMSENYLRENFEQLHDGEEDLKDAKSGMLMTDFPKTWTNPSAWNPESDIRTQLTYLGRGIDKHQTLLLVMFDKNKRAPGSDTDFLGHMSLGCVMENMWLTAEALGIGMHILTVFGEGSVAKSLRDIVTAPENMSIAFACSIGYPIEPSKKYLRVRREVGDFVHHNHFGTKAEKWPSAN
jgi:nitroreductase